MQTTTNINEALKIHESSGGYLLDMGQDFTVNAKTGQTKHLSTHTYCICDYDDAISLGRTDEQLDSLNKFSEI